MTKGGISATFNGIPNRLKVYAASILQSTSRKHRLDQSNCGVMDSDNRFSSKGCCDRIAYFLILSGGIVQGAVVVFSAHKDVQSV